MMNLMRAFVTGMTTFSMLITNVATAAIPVRPAVDLNRVANYLNEHKAPYKELVEDFKNVDSKKGYELERYIATHPDYHDVSLPKAIVENDKIVFVIEGVKTSITFGAKGAMDLSVQNKQIHLDYSMPIDQMSKTITEAVNAKEFSLVSFFIEDAQAMAPQAVALLGLSVFFAFAVHAVNLANNFKTHINSFKEWCSRLDGVAPNDDLIAIYGELYNKLGDEYIEVCVPGKFTLPSRGYQKDACRDLPEVKKCLKKKLDQVADKGINDSSRGQSKEIHYEKSLDKYIPTATSK